MIMRCTLFRLPFLLSAVVASATAASATAGSVEDALDGKLIPWGTSFRAVCAEIVEADLKADRHWTSLKSRNEYDARRKEVRGAFVAAIGGFPDKCALNSKITATVVREGYRVEKLYFESMPGVFVTANLYLPDEKKFKPPYPAFLIACGHAGEGKGNAGYGRGCVMGALQGFAVLIYDPIGQGERTQIPDTNNCAGHNRFGALAALLGRSTAQFRIWDGIRAMDYLDSRMDIRHDGYGIMGNSGGGTLSALIMALDTRVKAAAPSCYLTNFRELCMSVGPQDAEQNTFGQLAFGLNHAALVLLGDNAVRMHCCHADMFPFSGSQATFDVVRETARNCELPADRYGMTDVPGYHGWKESLRLSSLAWMRKWLKADRYAKIDVMECRFVDAGFDIKKTDSGLGAKDCRVIENGDVRKLPGFKSIYEYLKDDLASAEKRRAGRSIVELAAVVRNRTGIRRVGSVETKHRVVSDETKDGVRIVKEIFAIDGGYEFPAVTLVPEKVSSSPILLLGDGDRKNRAKDAEAALVEGSPVMVADVVGTGELGTARFKFYDAVNPEENVAVMYYLLGKSLVGVRAEQIAALAKFHGGRFKMPVDVRADGRVSIAAAHAYAVERPLFSAIRMTNEPMGWAEAVMASAFYPFANVVNGALLDYDWKELTQ